MSIEAKKLALLRIFEILQKNTDETHPLTHNEIAEILLKEYGIDKKLHKISFQRISPISSYCTIRDIILWATVAIGDI